VAALNILALNSGSSSLKYGLYRLEGDDARVLGEDQLSLGGDDGGIDVALSDIQRRLEQGGLPPPQAIGHRVVHGGPKLMTHRIIDPALLSELESAAAFAPLHVPRSLQLIHGAKRVFDDVPQVACFDTCFHKDLPDIASTLPVDRALREQGIRRYGFHGLSCESILRQLGEGGPRRLIIAHLGSGASVSAVLDGQSIDTSMGLTPSGGCVMGTRSGDLDPGVLIYLMRQHGMNAAQIEQLIDHRSGLLGVSGVSGDLRRLHEAAATQQDAELALRLFYRSVARQIASMMIALGGVELIVFSGGIGEHDALARAGIVRDLESFGVKLDLQRNRSGESRIDRTDSMCRLQLIRSQEDEQIARHAYALLTQTANHRVTQEQQP
jgi:acetate kinase